MPVVRGLCSGFGALFGGVGLGASIELLEHVTDRPLVWATAQYLEFARPPDVVELEVDEVVRGHASSQARVLARVDGNEVFTVVAALGRREYPWSGEWAVRPTVPSPDDCPPRPLAARFAGSIAERLDMRIANGRTVEQLDGTPLDDGRSALWVRLPDLPVSAASLAIVADYVPMGIGQAIGRPISGNSIDNTIRIVTLRPSDWLLIDIRVQALARGFGHGVVHLWAQDGTLLATASQSVIVRDLRPDFDEDAGAANDPKGGGYPAAE